MPGAEKQPGLRVLLDQNVPNQVGSWLINQRPSWQVVHTSDVGLQGMSDAEVYAWAQTNEHLVITFDTSFADGRSFPVADHHGIIRLRVWPTTIEETSRALARLLQETDDSELEGALVIVGRHRIRISRGSRQRRTR